jgi:DNA polymerase-3 subunit alpha
MPDFDIDFCQENRGRVINYVTEKYGQPSVSQIITYGKLQTRAAIRDVGRVMGMAYAEVDVVSKLIPEKLGITLEEAIETEPRLKEMMEQDPKINTLMDLAKKVEGLVRHAGIHAAGVIIAEGRLVDHAPLYRGVEGENVVQYDMKHAEKLGLIKFDFLGLKTLTHIQDALRLIEKNRKRKVTTQSISLKDPGIYEIMCKGDTAGIFQFEGEGITDLIRKAKPNCFEDIVAINALYRPGPMDMIPDYLARKSGQKEVTYLFPELEDVLKETYGVVVYQEQVQLVAARIASYSLGEADMLRRAMGKKIAEEMAQQKQRFLKGASANKHDAKKSEELFDTMAEFAKYGFNKSHAAAYCVIAAYTAWLKNYYPVEFFAALLSTEMGDTDKVVKYVKDAQKRGIEVRPPHINYSEFKFNVEGERIFFSLGAIKGVGQSAVDAIVEARETQPEKKFDSLEIFFEAVDLRRVNKKTIECLVRAGAFDDFGYNRNELMSSYVKFIERAERAKKDQEMGQTSLFALDTVEENHEAVQVEKMRPWTRTERLSAEKEVLGFYLSDHPLNGLESLNSYLHTQAIESLPKEKSKTTVRVLGLVTTFREIITKKGTRMAFAQFEDLTGSLELVIFPDAYVKAEMNLKSELPLIVTGQLEVSEEGATKILVETVESYDLKLRQAKRIVFQVNDEMGGKMALLKELLHKYPGEIPVRIRADLKSLGQMVDLEVKDPKGVQASPALIEGVQGLFGRADILEIL